MKNFKSLPQLLDHFKDEETCIEYYEQLRWKGNPKCPHCGSENPYKTTRGYKCSNNECYKKFTVKIGTIFEKSRIPMRLWFAAIYLCTVHKKGISSVQLSIDLGVTQKTAWFMLHRIREMLKEKAPQMIDGNKTVEMDETYIGGKEENRHYSKKRSAKDKTKRNDGTDYKPLKMVVGIIERDGKVVLKHFPRGGNTQMMSFIKKTIKKGSDVYTDQSKIYNNLRKWYTHDTVNHSLKVFVKGNVHTNTIENFWSVLKRGINGIYHQISDKHIERYLNEFAARFNNRELDSEEKFEKFLKDSGVRLSYKELIQE